MTKVRLFDNSRESKLKFALQRSHKSPKIWSANFSLPIFTENIKEPKVTSLFIIVSSHELKVEARGINIRESNSED